ncbi:MAG: 2-oxo-4-hydroxy-4-carboxy-5-ureidoimidazoline decarboxylase [Leptolyngbyaceae cyanobacterium bins.349]|nr:2-oxo-4-hydroxy-4-carboxy-5-ureidoimidazoline decarboxylase [Leptolyngbyaceae cyanobacterium bins.349]
MAYTLAELNQMSQAEFVTALGAVFEDTPAIAQTTWQQRPFTDLTDLHRRMVAVVQAMTEVDQLALICAHPDLGSKAKMADASVQEQAGVGLDRLSPEEFDRFHALNQQYRDTFGFPFIIAVKGHTKASILAAFEQRLTHDRATEHQQALTEIAQIARFRLEDLLSSC